MALSTQREKADRFRALHNGNELVLLPCAWDVASARLFEDQGYPAIGTTSAGVAATMGHRDGQRMALPDYLAVIRRIVESVDVPLSVDIEGGYGRTVDEVVDNVRAVLDAGAIGFNVEDEDHFRTYGAPLEPIGHMVRKIEALRDMSTAYGIPAFINAKTDAIWLESSGDEEARLQEAVTRANVYGNAGADLVFVPGELGIETIRRLAAEVRYPLNIVMKRETPEIDQLQRLGIKRLSMGSGPMRASLGLIRNIARAIRAEGTYQSSLNVEIPYGEVQQLFGH